MERPLLSQDISRFTSAFDPLQSSGACFAALFSEVEIDSKAHEQGRANKAARQRLAQRNQTDDRPNERRGGEVCPGPSRAYFAEREDEQDKAQPVAKETDQSGCRYQAKGRKRRSRRERQRGICRPRCDAFD